MGRLILGLDIGITSVGYGVVDIDNNQFVDYGVRLFKEGTAADNEKRRASRGGRRLRRRKQTRLLDMKHYLEEVGIKEKEYTPLDNPYEIRKKGLSEKLSLQELTTALLHLTKNRGTTLEALESTTEDDEGTKSILNKNSLLLGDDKFICEVQLERLASEGKIRGIDNNFKTDDYIKEAKQILKNQDLSEEVINRIISILQRRRQYYEGPGSAKSPTIYGRWVDFGVEPIDLIEKMRGKCSIFPDELRAPKNCYTSELFNFLNDLNNLSIDNEKITTEQKEGILEIINSKGGMSIKDLTKFLDVPLEDIHGFRIDKNNKPLLTPFTGYKKFKKLFDTHHENCYVDDKSIIDNIADIVTSKKGITERFDAIKKKYPELSDDLILDLSNVKGITQYHSLSLKAMHMINEEMLKSPLNQMQILHQLDMMNKTRKSLKGEKKIYADDTAILSPVAKRAQRETFKVINALRDKYGEFESIVIEMTRDKNTQEQKKHIEERNKRNENNNKAVDALLKEKGYDPSLINGKTKMKVRLYIDQDGKTAYTLQSIDLNHLISDPTAFEIDHIIPISISLDDSYANKVLVTRTENQVKGNLTPIDAYLKGKFTGCDLNTYKTYTKSHHQYGQKKKGYLLYDKDITKFSNIQEFIARNLVDTSYACRVVLNTLQHYFRDNEIPTKVHTVKGTATHIFRKRIHLEKDREHDYLHHAIDALIIATIKKLPIYRNYLIKYDLDTLYNEKTGEFMHVGDNNEILDPMYIDFIHNLKKIHEESYQYYNGMIERKEMKFRPIKISHKVDTKPNRQISDETIYSTRNIDDEEKIVKKYKDIYDPQFSALTESIINNDKVDKWLMQRNDPETFEMIKKIILDHFILIKTILKFIVKIRKTIIN